MSEREGERERGSEREGSIVSGRRIIFGGELKDVQADRVERGEGRRHVTYLLS